VIQLYCYVARPRPQGYRGWVVVSASSSISGRRLEGKTTIITGAASGMGRASVDRFLAEGANVIAVDLDGEGAEQAIADAGDRGVAYGLDVMDGGAIGAMITETVDRFGALDCYFNNAGVPQVAAWVEDVTDEEWKRSIDVNLTAIFLAARHVVPVMKRQGAGVILITASVSGLRPRPRLASYTAAKGGAVNLARALAIELAEFGIRVNSINPVSTDTPMLAQFGVGEHTTAKATPMGRLGRADEVASTAAFLASDDASFITGSAINVDGGRGI
jgi:3-oxoacyl-[acyl-carrier protein] reductase